MATPNRRSRPRCLAEDASTTSVTKRRTIEAFEEIRRRLMEGRATDGVVTDFGRKLSLFFRDPDAMECEVLVANPTPGTREIGSAVPEYEPVPLD